MRADWLGKGWGRDDQSISSAYCTNVVISDKSLPLSVLLFAQLSMREIMHTHSDNWEFILQKYPENQHRVNKKEFITHANRHICSPHITKVSNKHRFSKFHFQMPSQPTAEGPASVRPQPGTLWRMQPRGPSGSKSSDMSSLQCVFPGNSARDLALDLEDQPSDTPFLNVSHRSSDKIIIASDDLD